MNNPQKIIAVDFDGTLCIDKYPDIGEPIPPIIDYIKGERARGAYIILNTCRHGEDLTLSVEWSKNQGLIFDAVNENAPFNIEQYGNCRKIYADEYIDDHNKFINWRAAPWHKSQKNSTKNILT